MTNSDNHDDGRNETPFRKIVGLERYLLSLTVLCYVVGFAITNLFLGSLGVSNFDVLRVRYVLTGLLFIFFIAIVVLPLYGLIHVLRKYSNRSGGILLVTAFFYTLERYSAIYLAVFAIGVFASTKPNLILGIVSQNTSSSGSDQLTGEILRILQQSLGGLLVLIGISLSVLVVLSVIFVLINPKDKDGKRPARKSTLQKIWAEVRSKENLTSYVKILFIVFMVMVGIFAISRLLGFVTNNSSNTTSAWRMPGGSLKFVSVAFLLYVSASIYLLGIFSLPSRANNDNEVSLSTDDPLDSYYKWIYLFSLCIIVIVPIYAFNIYPEIPQRIGGGEPVEVQVFSNDNLLPSLSDANTRQFILDRTAEAVILLLYNEQQQSQIIVEIAESEIRSIIYKQPTVLPVTPIATQTAIPSTNTSILTTPTP